MAKTTTAALAPRVSILEERIIFMQNAADKQALRTENLEDTVRKGFARMDTSVAAIQRNFERVDRNYAAIS